MNTHKLNDLAITDNKGIRFANEIQGGHDTNLGIEQ